MSLLEDLSWRYACQEFQPGQRCDPLLAKALEAARLAPSSFGVQPWRIIEVDDPALRADLPDLCYGQDSVRDAGHLLVFACCDPLTEGHLRAHAALVAKQRGFTPDETEAFVASLVKTLLTRQSEEQRAEWIRAQCYLGLGVFLAACAQLRIDTCPMEGFLAEKVTQHLGLKAQGLRACVLVTAGYRAPSDQCARAPKVRMDPSEFTLRLSRPQPHFAGAQVSAPS